MPNASVQSAPISSPNVRVSIQPSLANRSTSGPGRLLSTVGESATAVAPPSVGAVRQANIIVPGNCRV